VMMKEMIMAMKMLLIVLLFNKWTEEMVDG
jgi:hypothetical protein